MNLNNDMFQTKRMLSKQYKYEFGTSLLKKMAGEGVKELFIILTPIIFENITYLASYFTQSNVLIQALC